MISNSELNNGIRVAGLLGVLLSIYALIVETAKEHDDSYSAMCDISEHVSCSKVFTSPYGRGFGLLRFIVGQDSALNVPNSTGGVVFYLICIMLSCYNSEASSKALLILAIVSNMASVYLAIILYFVLYDLCIVCVTTYIVNAAILALVLLKLRNLRGGEPKLMSKMS